MRLVEIPVGAAVRGNGNVQEFFAPLRMTRWGVVRFEHTARGRFNLRKD